MAKFLIQLNIFNLFTKSFKLNFSNIQFIHKLSPNRQPSSRFYPVIRLTVHIYNRHIDTVQFVILPVGVDFLQCLVHLLRAFLLEDDAEIVAGEDHALALGLLCVYVHASDEEGVGTAHEDQQEEADNVGDPTAQFYVIWWLYGFG